MTVNSQTQIALSSHWRSRIPILTTYLLLVGLTLNLLAFTLYIDFDAVSQDYWRFVHLIDDYHTGNLTLDGLLRTTNPPFRSISVPAVILFDGLVFHLALTPIYVAAILFLALVSALVVELIRRENAVSPLVLPMLVLILMSPMLAGLLAYGHATFSMIRVASYLLVMILTARLLTRERRPFEFASWVVALFLVTVVVGGGYMPGLIGTLVLLMITVHFRTRVGGQSAGRVPFVMLVLTLAALTIACAILIRPEGRIRIGTELDEMAAADQLAELVRFFLSVLASSLLSYRAAEFPHWVHWLLGAVVAVAAVSCVARIRLRNPTTIDLLAASLAAHSLLVAAMISFSRAGLGSEAATATRYLADTTLWQAGLVLAIGSWFARRKIDQDHSRQAWRRFASTIALICVGLLCLAHLAALDAQWKMAQNSRAYAKRVAEALANHRSYAPSELQRQLGANDRQFSYVPDAIKTLERHQLNVFRQSK